MTKSIKTRGTRPLVALVLLACASAAHAGRHGSEEAAMVERGECELEATYERFQGSTPQVGGELSCGVGPLQLTGEAGHAHERGGSQGDYALEARWARPVREGLNAGVLLRAQWAAHQRPRYDATSVVGLLTWSIREDLDLHLNLGPEFVHRGGTRARWAVAPEWRVHKDLSLLAERFAIDGSHFFRGTVRWQVGGGWGFELGRAVRLSGPEPSRWTIAVTVDLGGD